MLGIKNTTNNNQDLLMFQITNTEYGQQLALLKVDYTNNIITARLIFDTNKIPTTHPILYTKKGREYFMFNRKQYYLEDAVKSYEIGGNFSCFHPEWCKGIITEILGEGCLS